MHGTTARPAIDLSRHHFVREWKDLCIVGTWLHNEDQEDDEPALVIVPRYRRRGYLPVCIALSAAYKYNSAKYLARASQQFCRSLGFEDSMANANKIAEAIHSHLLDLLSMPTSPTTSIILGEASMTMADGVKRTVEFLDHTPTMQQ